jgi:hypothetical protein
MRALTLWQTFVWAIVLSAAWVGLQAWTSDERDVVTLASSAAFFFVIVFFSMRLSARVTTWTQSRFGSRSKAEPPAPPPESTTERPEHAQRRRERARRRRGPRSPRRRQQ